MARQGVDGSLPNGRRIEVGPATLFPTTKPDNQARGGSALRGTARAGGTTQQSTASVVSQAGRQAQHVSIDSYDAAFACIIHGGALGSRTRNCILGKPGLDTGYFLLWGPNSLLALSLHRARAGS